MSIDLRSKIIALIRVFTDVCNGQSTACNNGGYMDPKNCAICKCPDGFSGASCTDRQPASNGTDTCGASLTATSDAQIILARVGNDQQTLAPQFTTCYWHIDVRLAFVLKRIIFCI